MPQNEARLIAAGKNGALGIFSGYAYGSNFQSQVRMSIRCRVRVMGKQTRKCHVASGVGPLQSWLRLSETKGRKIRRAFNRTISLHSRGGLKRSPIEYASWRAADTATFRQERLEFYVTLIFVEFHRGRKLKRETLARSWRRSDSSAREGRRLTSIASLRFLRRYFVNPKV